MGRGTFTCHSRKTMTDQETKPKKRVRKYNPAWKDYTRNQRTQEREAMILAECQRLGFESKSALLTALVRGEIVEIVRKGVTQNF